jgi:hypothetical protein
MSWTTADVERLAPDSSSAKDARKNAAPGRWSDLGRTAEAVWGACQGSGKDPYKVKVDLHQFAFNCTCPSRKLPCKHTLALLLLLAEWEKFPIEQPEAPDWVAAWIEKRREKSKPKEPKEAEEPKGPPDPKKEAAKSKRADSRDRQVADGLADFKVWLEDLMRGGLAGVSEKPASFWEQRAARLVDAKCARLAGRVRALGELVGSGSDWPERLLSDLGWIALLIESQGRAESLPEALRDDVRQELGWPVRAEDLKADTALDDTWFFAAREVIELPDRVLEEKTWVIGQRTGVVGLLLQFAAGQMKVFPDRYPMGRCRKAKLTPYPGAWPSRYKLGESEGDSSSTPLPAGIGFPTVSAALDRAATIWRAQPWATRIPLLLERARFGVDDAGRWHLSDVEGLGLPISGDPPWTAIAAAGAAGATMLVEWDGRQARPLAAILGERSIELTRSDA